MIYTSYYAVMGKIPKDIVKVSISRGIPSWYHGESYNKLAPLWETVKRYKDGGLWLDYVQDYYYSVLNKINPEDAFGDLMRISYGRDVVLLCYEKPTDNCHRKIVSEWFNEAGIECMEYKF